MSNITDKYIHIINCANQQHCNVLINEPMKKHTTFKIGGNADLLLEIPNKTALLNVLKNIKKNKIKYLIIGNGSNILVGDAGIKCVVIKLIGNFENIELIDNKIICGSGAKLTTLCNFAKNNSLSGLEFAYGIPGTVGGAIHMNAGAYGGEIKDVVFNCKYLKENLNEVTLNKEQLKFGYRTSVFKGANLIITQVTFLMHRGQKNIINNKMKDCFNKRKEKQPLEYPSAGSVFKRPKNNYAGSLIQECNLKNKNVGGAYVSEKHAGFIINKRNATCEDVEKLIKEIKNKVKQEKNINLECEIKKIGE